MYTLWVYALGGWLPVEHDRDLQRLKNSQRAGETVDDRNQKRRERRRANPLVKARERAYREANHERISLYRKQNSEDRAAYKRSYRRRHPSEAIGYAHRTGRDLVQSGVLSFSVMRGGGNEIADARLSVLDELMAYEGEQE